VSKKKFSSQFDLSIVVPAYQEEKRIGKTLDEISNYLKQEKRLKDSTIEVIVVAADSSDKTWDIVQSKRSQFETLRLLKPGPKVGKGRDVQYGMLRAKGRAVIFMDADLATPLHHLAKFYEAFQEGAEVVVATRNLRKHHPNYLRRLISNGGNLLFKLAGGVWLEDSQCGFKLFSQDAAASCFSRLKILGWGFDMEVLAIAKANRYKIESYRVNDWVSVSGGTFEEGLMQNSVRSLIELASIFYGRLSGRYRTEVEIEMTPEIMQTEAPSA
jgi:dolichyl-phosphate beta-glucosyltransferase